VLAITQPMKNILNHLKENWIRHGFETLVVTIGILGAFTLDNWNEERTANKFEDKLLSELHDRIIESYENVNSAIRADKEIISSCKFILSHFDKKLSYHDSLSLHFVNANNWSILIPRQSAFDNAKSYGLHFISDDTTRFKLTNLYEYQISWLNTLNERQTLYYYNTVVPLLTELFNSTRLPWRFKEGVVPYDFELLSKNKKYRNILESNIKNRGYEIEWMQGVLKEMKDLEKRLELEIGKN
jgi:hypothetical protein